MAYHQDLSHLTLNPVPASPDWIRLINYEGRRPDLVIFVPDLPEEAPHLDEDVGWFYAHDVRSMTLDSLTALHAGYIFPKIKGEGKRYRVQIDKINGGNRIVRDQGDVRIYSGEEAHNLIRTHPRTRGAVFDPTQQFRPHYELARKVLTKK